MKKPKEIPLRLPPPVEGVKEWLVMGLDPSMSRTGYALMHVMATGGESTFSDWVDVGSIKPEVAANPIWLRGKGMAMFLKERLQSVADGISISQANQAFVDRGVCPDMYNYESLGLLISMEYPTPMNDFLVALNRIIHLVFFEGPYWKKFQAIRILTTNASTLRSLMGLFTRGKTNKKENILKAYEFIDREKWPSLDPDSCDAVLLAMMGRHAASILLGRLGEVPGRFLNSLCSDVKLLKGKGRRERMITAGIMHRPEYFYEYKEKQYVFCFRDASSGKAGLGRETYRI